ncbi:hypothetical protein Efla_007299 [Eimeria flavescens]
MWKLQALAVWRQVLLLTSRRALNRAAAATATAIAAAKAAATGPTTCGFSRAGKDVKRERSSNEKRLAGRLGWLPAVSQALSRRNIAFLASARQLPLMRSVWTTLTQAAPWVSASSRWVYFTLFSDLKEIAPQQHDEYTKANGELVRPEEGLFCLLMVQLLLLPRRVVCERLTRPLSRLISGEGGLPDGPSYVVAPRSCSALPSSSGYSSKQCQDEAASCLRGSRMAEMSAFPRVAAAAAVAAHADLRRSVSFLITRRGLESIMVESRRADKTVLSCWEKKCSTARALHKMLWLLDAESGNSSPPERSRCVLEAAAAM